MMTRDQLELVIQKKKVDEVYKWFREHFVDTPKDQYVARCPFLVIQGPTGSGKTITLRSVANLIGVPVIEFSETADLTYIDVGMREDSNIREAEDRSLDRWRATRFQKFVEEKIRFVPLPDPTPIAPSADSEFDSESDQDLPCTLRTKFKPVEQKPSGIIIHVEEPLTFSRSQKLLMSTLTNIIKTFKQLARYGPRRAAIVFENFDSDRQVVSLPAKFKQAIGLEVIKFNPIIRSNMKKFIDLKLRSYQNIVLDKEAVDALVNDCDGDLSACINSLEMMSTRIHNRSNIISGFDDDILTPLKNFQVNKRQRLNPERFKLNSNLMRDVTRSCGFFHLLGKVFYQKRLYPDNQGLKPRKYRSVERPYALENSTDYLTSRLSIDPKVLLTWLHQHYQQFCGATSINKASLFLEHLSDTDTISINSMQSSQFYEMHHIVDQQQINLALEITSFSLYEDRSSTIKSSHKKVHTERGTFIVKSSVENSNGNSVDLYSFNRPECLSLPKVIEDRRVILSYLTDSMIKEDLGRTHPTKILVDYLPYLSIMSDLCSVHQANGFINNTPPIHSNETRKLIKILERLDCDKKPNMEFEEQHEKLAEVIERLEEDIKIKTKGGGEKQDGLNGVTLAKQ